MIDICLFGRDIGSRPRLRDEPAFYPTFISRAGIIIRPIVVVVVVEESSRDLRCDDYIVRCERYKKFGKELVSLSPQRSSSCSVRPTDTTIRSRRRSSSRINRMYEFGKFFSWHHFRALHRRTGNEHDETPRDVLSMGYFTIAIVGLMLDDRRGAMS